MANAALRYGGDARVAQATGPVGPPGVLVREQGRWTVVQVEGELDHASSVDLAMVLGDAVIAGKLSVAIDMSRAGFLDSSGIRCVAQAARRVSQQGGKLVLVAGAAPGLRRKLELMGLAELVPVLPTLPD